MNYMQKQEILKVRKLATYVGHFIRYWSFRQIHGEIWTLVYLSSQPLSGIEIAKTLKVSKALVSPALKELEDEGLIFQVKSENSKTKRYEAQEDVEVIIKSVLKRREQPMLEKISQSFTDLQNEEKLEGLNSKRLEKVGEMIHAAQLALLLLVSKEQVF